MTISMQSFVHSPQSTMNNSEALLRNLEGRFPLCIMICFSSICLKFQTNNSVLPVIKYWVLIVVSDSEK